MAKKQFKAQSKKLLDMMIHSIYTNKEIFLREIISNASDAIDKMCLLAHTGGTTGVPKAVMLSDRAMNAVASEQISIYKTLKEYKRGSVFLQVMIPFVVYGILTCIHMPLCAGWCLALVPKFDGKDWKKYISQYKFSYVFAVPAYVNALLENKDLRKTNLSMLKIIAAGGDGINNDMEHNVNKFLYEHGSKAELFKGYGMTEICAAALVSTPVANRVGSVGIPLPKNNVMIYDRESKAELTYGGIGEICMQCPSRMLGYKDYEEATKELFWTHEDGSEWLHTGDLGYMDEDGFLFLVGRIKRIILTTKDGVAYKVFPNIPEEMIVKHEAVAQCCIVGAMDGANQVLRAFIVPDKSWQSDTAEMKCLEQELRSFCEERLPEYSRPTFYEFRDSLPLTAAGKVDYRALEKG